MVTPEADEAAADTSGYIGDDIFLKAKSSHRDRLPVSLRQGRHVAKRSRRARRRSYNRAQAPQRMYLVDDLHVEDHPAGQGHDHDGKHDGKHDGNHDDHLVHQDHAETTRIALRLRFEDFSAADDVSESQESVAG